jgi:hypothetical protein
VSGTSRNRFGDLRPPRLQAFRARVRRPVWAHLAQFRFMPPFRMHRLDQPIDHVVRFAASMIS